MQILRIILPLLCLTPILNYYSPYYKKCKLFSDGIIDMGSLKVQRVPEYEADFNFTQQTNTTLPLKYQPLDFIYDEYVDAGGSGEVYRVQNLLSGKVRILKRFFKENVLEFEQQNYVMHQMNYEVQWHREDNNPNKSTMASYPSKESVVLRDLQIQTEHQIAVIFYKICREVSKAHRKGIIHDDIKMGNILIHSVGEGLRSIDVQLIDWNLATFYSKGYDSNQKKGTVCYYAPESILRTTFATPAIDIWALAVVYFTFITDKKPFPLNCKNNNLEAILGFIGSQKFLEVYEKYNKISGMEISTIEQIKKKKNYYEGISLRDRIPQQHEKNFDEELIDLFEKMLEIDPEYRLTINQVLNHPYFDRVKRLPKMYVEKNKRKQKQTGNINSKHAPANNLIRPEKPIMDEKQL